MLIELSIGCVNRWMRCIRIRMHAIETMELMERMYLQVGVGVGQAVREVALVVMVVIVVVVFEDG